MISFVRPVPPYNRYVQNVPLNYIHLAAYLREQGFRSAILDMVLSDVTPAHVDRVIREQGARVAGIGCVTCEFPQAVAEARRLKAAHPGLKVVFGAAHPSGDPEECLRTGVVDYVIVGEGEIALAELLRAVEAGGVQGFIPGVWSMKDGAIQPGGSAPVPLVADLPRPAYDLLDLEKYFQLDSPWHFTKSPRVVQFLTERGCPYRCSYCHEIHAKRFRGVPAETIVDQMEWLVRSYGVSEFIVVDDIFNFDLERAKRICRGIIERKLDIHLQFPNGVRGDRFDEELIALMKQAGTHFLAIAIETVSEKYQKLIRKNLKVDRALETIHWARKHGIEVSGFFMVGFPGETLEEVNRTLDFAVNAPLDAIIISLVAPFKGTQLRTDMLNGGFGEMGAAGMAALDQLFPTAHNRELPFALLQRLQRAAYWRFYTKPRNLLSLGRRLTNRRSVSKVLRAVRRHVLDREVINVN